jgi:general secretion pathway protein G
MILASVTIPLVRNGLKREKEIELRRDLREMRQAIDTYKQMAEQQKIKAPAPEANFYPESLEMLVEGVPASGTIDRKVRFLRRIPVDPFTRKAEWGMRNSDDDANSTSWGGGHVYDVYSLAPGTGMNGIPYHEW